MAGMNKSVVLAISCGNCCWFDGDCYCGLPWRNAMLRQAILEPDQVVCAKQEHEDIEGAAV